MFEFITKSIITGISAIGIFIGGIFGMVSDDEVAKLQDKLAELQIQLENRQDSPQNLGSYYAVGGKYYKLWGSGINSSDTSVVLTSFKSPINDQELVMGNFGEIGFGTIEPENTSNMEFISFTGITQAGGSDQATLTGVTRGLNFVYPYNASTSLAKAHAGGSRFIISNPPMHYERFTAKDNDEFIEGNWTFYATNTPQYFSAPTFGSASNEFASVKFVEAQANQGAATISTTTPGIGLIATSDVLRHFSTTTGYASSTPWLLRAYDAATSTDKRGATTTIMLTDTDGKLDQSFLDKTEALTWTGDVTFSSTTLNATTTIGDSTSDQLRVNASSTFYSAPKFISATSTFDRPPLIDSESANATSTNFYNLATVGYAKINDLKYEQSTTTDLFRNGAGGIWHDWNIASSTPADAKYIELMVLQGGNSKSGVRKDGSSLARINPVQAAASMLFSITVETVPNSTSSGSIEIYNSDGAGNAGGFWITGYWRPR